MDTFLKQLCVEMAIDGHRLQSNYCGGQCLSVDAFPNLL